MLTFFHGWRRKTGCVTLVLACVIMSASMRSHIIHDHISFLSGTNSIDFLISAGGSLFWARSYKEAEQVPNIVLWSTNGFTFPHGTWDTYRWQYQWGGFAVGETISNLPFFWISRTSVCAVPYWSVVLATTLLSAYLILWKPRKSTSGLTKI